MKLSSISTSSLFFTSPSWSMSASATLTLGGGFTGNYFRDAVRGEGDLRGFIVDGRGSESEWNLAGSRTFSAPIRATVPLVFTAVFSLLLSTDLQYTDELGCHHVTPFTISTAVPSSRSNLTWRSTSTSCLSCGRGPIATVSTATLTKPPIVTACPTRRSIHSWVLSSSKAMSVTGVVVDKRDGGHGCGDRGLGRGTQGY